MKSGTLVAACKRVTGTMQYLRSPKRYQSSGEHYHWRVRQQGRASERSLGGSQQRGGRITAGYRIIEILDHWGEF